MGVELLGRCRATECSFVLARLGVSVCPCVQCLWAVISVVRQHTFFAEAVAMMCMRSLSVITTVASALKPHFMCHRTGGRPS